MQGMVIKLRGPWKALKLIPLSRAYTKVGNKQCTVYQKLIERAEETHLD